MRGLLAALTHCSQDQTPSAGPNATPVGGCLPDLGEEEKLVLLWVLLTGRWDLGGLVKAPSPER